jgi:hypothetical protein
MEKHTAIRMLPGSRVVFRGTLHEVVSIKSAGGMDGPYFRLPISSTARLPIWSATSFWSRRNCGIGRFRRHLSASTSKPSSSHRASSRLMSATGSSAPHPAATASHIAAKLAPLLARSSAARSALSNAR